MLELLQAVGSILLIDIVLNGDNALVIGAAAAGLEQRRQRAAILAGGAGAVVLRIVFAMLASFLLLLPWLQATGGVILLFIAIRLVMGREQEANSPRGKRGHEPGEPGNQKDSRGFFAALLTILVADVTMSLDNVLAVGALAHGNLLALTIGILLSVALLMIGSTLVARLIRWLPWLLDIAALVLAWTGADMMLRDQHLGDLLNNYSWTSIALPIASLGIVLLADALFRLRAQKQAHLSQ